ncbi:MAG: carbohydrate binding domain-containing protein [Candidatus Omnitrophota bacterium]
MKKIIASVFVIAAIVLAQMTPALAAELIVADFDAGEKPNNLGGDMGMWDKDPNDTTMYARMAFVPDDALDNPDGYSLKMDYDIDSPNPAYNGFWMKLEGLDIETYKTLDLYVKGDKEQGYTKKFKIELKNATGEVGKYTVTGIGDGWEKISIPLEKFKALKDKANMTEFVIVFDDMTSTKKVGTIYIDQIGFSD